MVERGSRHSISCYIYLTLELMSNDRTRRTAAWSAKEGLADQPRAMQARPILLRVV